MENAVGYRIGISWFSGKSAVTIHYGMEAPAEISIRSKAWRPEQGWPLFLAWMVGVVALQVFVSIVIATRTLPADPFKITWKHLLPTLVAASAAKAWQAWLLFPKHPVRFAAWSVLPIAEILLPAAFSATRYRLLVTPLIEAAIIQGVRRRAWAWILAGLGGVVLVEASFWSVSRLGVYGLIRQALESTFGKGSSLTAMAWAASGIHRGIWVLSEALSAAVLAWKMPPMTSPRPETEQDETPSQRS